MMASHPQTPSNRHSFFAMMPMNMNTIHYRYLLNKRVNSAKFFIPVLSQEIPQVPIGSEFHDDEYGCSLGAAANESDYVHMVPDRLHQFHLLHQADNVLIFVLI